jgi:serine phosphatase RsbU (regulator of sigma subunit)
MSEFRSLLRTLALQSDAPEQILTEAERIADALAFDRAATCVVAVVDAERRTCRFANAGHMPPLLIRPDGTSALVRLPIDPPLGVGTILGGRTSYRGETVEFEPGSTLLFYTDGLVERRGKDIDDCVSALTTLDLDPRRPLEMLLDTVLSRFLPQGAEDDVAVLAARLLPVPAQDSGSWTLPTES